MPDDLYKIVVQIRNGWSLSAFAIAAIVLGIGSRVPKAKPSSRKLLFSLALVPAVIALVPIVLSAYLQKNRDDIGTIFHVRINVVDVSDHPIESATIRASVPGQTSTTVAPHGPSYRWSGSPATDAICRRSTEMQ
jgi:hypothetical protein